MLSLSYTASLWLTISATLLHVVAICLTVFRLYYRRRIQRLWWDDYMAAAALVSDLVYVPIIWFSYAPSGSVLSNRHFLAARFWLGLELFNLVAWLSRMSLALAFARIFPPGEPHRRFGIAGTFLFVFLFLATAIQVAIQCPSHMVEIGNPPALVCNVNALFGMRVSIVTLEASSDIFLVVAPLYKLWRVKLPSKQRRLILTGFASSVVTTLGTIGCGVFQFAPESWNPGKQILRSKMGFFEAALTLIACNFLVLITYIDTRRRGGEDLRRSAPSETRSDTKTTDGEPVSHSNHVPNSSALTTLSLTQITMSGEYVDSYSSMNRTSSGGSTAQLTRNSEYTG